MECSFSIPFSIEVVMLGDSSIMALSFAAGVTGSGSVCVIVSVSSTCGISGISFIS